MKQWALRYLSYPTIFGGTAAAILWTATQGLPYWPTVPLMALTAIACIALLEHLQPYEAAWLADHGDTRTDSLHFLLTSSPTLACGHRLRGKERDSFCTIAGTLAAFSTKVGSC